MTAVVCGAGDGLPRRGDDLATALCKKNIRR